MAEIAYWPLNEATSGTAPSTALDDTGNGNNLVINYGASDAEYVTSDTGEGVDFTSPADDSGSARLSRSCTQGNLAASLSGVTGMSVVLRLDCHETANYGARAFHIGSASTNGDFSCFQITTTFNVMWDNDSGGGGVTKFPSLVGRGPTTVTIAVDSTQAAANDRIKVWYDRVQQTPTEASTVVQNSTIDPTAGTKYYTIGNRYDQTKPWLGTIYAVSVNDDILTDALAKAADTYLSEDNNRSWRTPVAITYAGYNDASGDVILEGTCNLDHTEISVVVDPSGNAELYKFKSLSDAWKVISNPFDIDPKVIRQNNALGILNESYVAYPQLYRLSNGNVLCTYAVGSGHADNTQRTRGMISTDGDTWDAVNNEFTIYDHPSNFATQGPGGGIDPSDNRPYFFFWYYNPVTGGRDERHIVRGDADGSNFAYLKDVNATLDWSDTNLVDGKPFYQYFGAFVPIGGEVFQLAYGRTRAWVLKWDQVAKDLVNKQLIYDNNATHAGGNEANALDNMGELTMVNIDDTFPARVVFYIRDQKNLDSFAACRGTLDSSGNFTLDTAYGQPEDNIEAWTTETINAGCTIRATRMGDHVLTTWGARLDAETIETTLIDKEMCWNDPLLAVRQNAENNRHTIYNMNPNAVGQGLDTGMPWPLLTTDGNAALIAFYDQQLVGDDDEASVYITTAARLTPDGI